MGYSWQKKKTRTQNLIINPNRRNSSTDYFMKKKKILNQNTFLQVKNNKIIK